MHVYMCNYFWFHLALSDSAIILDNRYKLLELTKFFFKHGPMSTTAAVARIAIVDEPHVAILSWSCEDVQQPTGRVTAERCKLPGWVTRLGVTVAAGG